jgi:hypothetical protein
MARNLRFTEAQLAAHGRGEKIVPTEHEEQVEFFKWWRRYAAISKIPECLCFAIPNASRLTDAGRVYKWAEGLTPGVSDIFMAIPRGKYHGLFIEMKRSVNAEVTAPQTGFLNAVKDSGYYSTIAWSADDAQYITMEYLSLQPT